MPKLRTASQFLERLDAELSWRKHDISSMVSAVNGSKGLARRALVRALVAITYAHWEGFTKAAVASYAQHISLQGKTYDSLIVSLAGLRALETVSTLGEIKRRIFSSSVLLNKLYSIGSETASISLESKFAKVGNLNYSMFTEMMEFVGIDTSTYSSKSALIDESLLKRRNTIAHGEFIELDEDEAQALVVEIFAILDRIKDDLGGAAAAKSYLRNPAHARPKEGAL